MVVFLRKMNAENKKTAIAGIHDHDIGEIVIRALERRGYEATCAVNMEDMRKEMDSNPNSSFYIMDINLGMPGEPFVEPALEAYNRIKESIEKGEVKFYGISGSPQVINMAIKSGIPKEHIINKGDDRFFDVLRGRE